MFSPITRSENMRRIRSKDTKPELFIRHLVFKIGYRYRLHGKNLPGKPDLVFGSRKKVIFIHGCFWHQHKNCKESHYPKTNIDYWVLKFQKTKIRDKKNNLKLNKANWSVLVVWECELKNPEKLIKTIKNFLGV